MITILLTTTLTTTLAHGNPDVIAGRQAQLDNACPEAPTLTVDFDGIEAIWPEMDLWATMARVDLAVAAVVEMCTEDGFEADYPGFFETNHSAIAQLHTLAVQPHSDGAGLTESLPAWSNDAGAWTIGIGTTTNDTLSTPHYRWLLFDSEIAVEGVPWAERRRHGNAEATLATAAAEVEAACGIELEVDLDWSEWTGSAFTYPWEDPAQDVLTLGFDPTVMANFGANFLAGLVTECQTDGALSRDLSRIILRPDPIAATHHDPAVYDPQFDTVHEENPFWTEDAGELTLYIWGGTANLTAEAQDFFNAGTAPSRCLLGDEPPPECDDSGGETGGDDAADDTAGDETAGDDGTGDGDGSGGLTTRMEDDSGSSTNGADDETAGCLCTAQRSSSGAWSMLALLGLLGLRRRQRR